MDNNLQNTLYGLIQSSPQSNLAFSILLHDYTKYHTVLLIEASIFALLLMTISVYFWRRFQRAQKPETRHWAFEKKAFFWLGFVSSIVTLFLLLIIVANLSTALSPQEGFVQVIPKLHTPQIGTQKAALYEAVNTWMQSGGAPMPSILKNEVQNRLSWQLPKAIVCSILLVIYALFTTYVWRKLIRSRAKATLWILKDKILLMIGMIAIPITLLLMIMALANTQSSFAPITLTLLFSESEK